MKYATFSTSPLQQKGDCLVLGLFKGEAPAAFKVDKLLQAGTWRSALDGGKVEVAAGGSLAAEVPAHGVQVYLLDAAPSRPDLVAALDAAMQDARRPR